MANPHYQKKVPKECHTNCRSLSAVVKTARGFPESTLLVEQWGQLHWLHRTSSTRSRWSCLAIWSSIPSWSPNAMVTSQCERHWKGSLRLKHGTLPWLHFWMRLISKRNIRVFFIEDACGGSSQHPTEFCILCVSMSAEEEKDEEEEEEENSQAKTPQQLRRNIVI